MRKRRKGRTRRRSSLASLKEINETCLIILFPFCPFFAISFSIDNHIDDDDNDDDDDDDDDNDDDDDDDFDRGNLKHVSVSHSLLVFFIFSFPTCHTESDWLSLLQCTRGYDNNNDDDTNFNLKNFEFGSTSIRKYSL